MPVVMRQMIRGGWEEGKNLFIYHIFHYSYLPIWALCSWEKIYIPTVSFLVTTMCNLDCRGCLNFTHFNKNKCHYNIERLKSDIDILFEKVDYVGYLHLSGGEPFIYPHLGELIDYIHSKYGNRIGILGTTTNGTIIPKEKLCTTIKNANVKVWIDDYRKNVKLAREKFESVNARLLEYGISPVCNYAEHWLDILDEKKETNETILCARCDACDVPFISLKEQKIYGCNYCDYAQEASIMEENSYDYLDLKQINQNERACITEFIMGYSINGYYSFCKKCLGYQANNQKQIKVAEQY
jgi:Predicted Fe-S oxidoreductases